MMTTRLKLPQPVAPMLASASEPPSGPGWAFEFKWDGVRAIAAATGDQVRLHSRNGNDITGGISRAGRAQRAGRGPSGAARRGDRGLDDAGRPDFGLLQQRMHIRSPSPQLVARVPISYYVFDLLDLDGRRLLPHSYQRRRDLLADLGLDGKSPRVRVPPHHTNLDGHQLLQIARRHGVEGVVGKRLNSRYQPGRRSPAWTKTALLTTHEVVIGGWTTGQGRRGTTLGALLLGAHDDHGRLRYLGHVGTGFTNRMLHHLSERLAALEQPHSPFDEPVPHEHARQAHWVHPQLVGEVEYQTLTKDHRLRHAAWRGLRADKDPAQVTLS